MKPHLKWSFILFFMSLLLTGCAAVVESADEVPEVLEVIEEPTEETSLERILKTLKAEVRVFDVVEHHDAIQELLELKMDGKAKEELEEIVAGTVQSHMDAFLKKRIETFLAHENPLYAKSDVLWVFDRLSTKELYRFMTLYEKAFYEQKMGW